MRGALAFAWPLARPVLQALDPERAHDLTLRVLSAVPLPEPTPDDPRLSVDAFGLRFANPIGLAAGFDKNGTIAHKAGTLGLGFVEVGTLTPRPQAGNSKPRLFRLPKHGAIINRFGFNNLGHAHAENGLRKGTAVVGINIGANKDATDRVGDYVAGINALASRADYFTINVSSPNTPNLRDLQKPDALRDLLGRVLEARDRLAVLHGRKPVLLKIAPDLTWNHLDAIIRVARDQRIDGLIVSNTTITRPAELATVPHGTESGGLSGQPLFALSTRMLAQAYVRVNGQFPLVGVGGIDSPDAACAKIEAGATLLQLYSGLVYAGPALITGIKLALLGRIGVAGTFMGLIGRSVGDWTTRSGS